MFLSLSAAREELQCYYISRSLLSFANEPRRAERDGRFRCVMNEGPRRVVRNAVREETNKQKKKNSGQEIRRNNKKKDLELSRRPLNETETLPMLPFDLKAGRRHTTYFKCHSFAIFKEASLKACAPHSTLRRLCDAWL